MREYFEKRDFGERIFFVEKEEMETRERLLSFLSEMAKELKNQGIPVDDRCRIQMEAFEKIYSPSKVKKDKEKIQELEEEWKALEASLRKEKKEGEELEVLKTLIFHKFCGKELLVVRSSRFDDIFNHVDNLMVEKETGNPVCAYDEVIGTSGELLLRKREKVLLRNTEGGVRLKYGISLQKGKIELGRISELPIFYLTYPKEEFKRGIKELRSLEEKSPYEEKIFAFFVALLDSQIKTLYLKSLPSLVEERIKKFEKFLKKVKR